MFFGSGQPIVTLQGVTHGFGESHVLRDLNLAISPGTKLAVTGPSGVGKTTMLGIIGLLFRPNAGTVRYFGQQVTSEGQAATLRRSHVSWILQTTNILGDLSIRENVAMGLVGRGEGLETAIARSKQHLDAVGLDSIANKRARLASGGERQRIGIARALSAGASLVIADEPTASLDGKQVQNMTALLMEASSRTSALLLASHDERAWRMCDDVVSLSEGRVNTNAG